MRLSNLIGKGFAVVVFTLALTSAGFGVCAHAQDGPPMGPGFENNSTGFEGMGTEGFQPANRPQRRRPPKIGDLLGRVLHDNMAAETLAELTIQDVSVSDIHEEMIGADLRDLLLSHEVSLEDFKAGMDLRSGDLLDRAVGCGLITDEEANSILEMIQNPPERPEPPESEMDEGGRPPRPNGPPTDTETM